MQTINYNELFNEKNNIHIRLNKRNNKKSITIVENLDKYLVYNKLSKLFTKIKQNIACGGNIINDNNNIILQFQGDHRDTIKNILIEIKLVDKNNIIIHGF